MHARLEMREEQGPVIAGPAWDEFPENAHPEGARDDELYVGGIRYPLNENDSVGSVENLPSASGNSQMSTTHLFDDDIPPMHDSQGTHQGISQPSSPGTSEVTSQVSSQATSHNTSQSTSQGSTTSESSEDPIVNGPPILHGPPILLDEAALQALEEEVRRIEAFVEHLDGFVRHLTDRSRDPNVEYHFQEFVPNLSLTPIRYYRGISRQEMRQRLERFNMMNLQSALEATPSDNSSTVETTSVGEHDQRTNEVNTLQGEDNKRASSANGENKKLNIGGDE
ncbi:uncharacterized protein LAJ45_10737 [Morchella importuna]|uniref:uncharacterized protein n=1 Tax=Morchella importuna TaxID=1174673 RepID=UPI001E8CFF6C|nr:uncharacterized protein LAJ45_10737 [Morchella importuna]KAH8145300.1 hypothetical protein LAJ45_10737 [Morchella importuna]